MYGSLTDAQVRELHAAALEARLAGSRVTKWNAGETGAERMLTLDLSDPNTWASIDAEFRLRFGAKRKNFSRTRVSFA